MGKVILYIAVSVDGKIAGPDDEIDWLDEFNTPDQDYGYNNFLDTCEATIMGSRTYDTILSLGDEFPYQNKKNYVFTNNPGLIQDDHVTFISSDHQQFIQNLKKESKQDIWLIGGGQINQYFITNALLDKLIIFIIPVFLGAGIALFEVSERTKIGMELIKSNVYPNGVVELNYIIIND